MKIEIILGAGFSDLFGKKSTIFYTEASSITVERVIAEFLNTYKEFNNKLKKQKILYTNKLNAIYVVGGHVVKKDFILKNNVTLKILPAIAGG